MTIRTVSTRAFFVLIVLSAAAVAGVAVPAVPAVTHPIVATPEKTLTTILDAYVRRDPAVVLAYVHPAIQKDADRMAGWTKLVGQLTTDTNHVIRVVDVELKSVGARGTDQVATLSAVIETTPSFSGGTDLGGNLRRYHWSLVQVGGTGAWYHDGGGF